MSSKGKLLKRAPLSNIQTWVKCDKGIHRPYMEDRCIDEIIFLEGLQTSARLVAVFDGHAGFEVAETLTTFYPTVMKDLLSSQLTRWQQLNDDVWMKDLLIEAHAFIDHTLWLQHKSEEKIKTYDRINEEEDNIMIDSSVGSTVVSMLQIKDKMFFMNVGDSRGTWLSCPCIDGDGDGDIKNNDTGTKFGSTVDHKPEFERERIQKAGGFVSTPQPPNIPRVNGMLGVSRAIGDFFLKTEEASQARVLQEGGGRYQVCPYPSVAMTYRFINPVVSPIPDITIVNLNSFHVYSVLLGSDGLWDVFSIEEAKLWQQKHLLAWCANGNHYKDVCDDACTSLLQQTLKSSTDNLTFILVHFNF
jgi:serine/threonine protein phosphatase PrpC